MISKNKKASNDQQIIFKHKINLYVLLFFSMLILGPIDKAICSNIFPFSVSVNISGTGTKIDRTEKKLHVDVVTANKFWDGKTRKEHKRILKAEDKATFVTDTIRIKVNSATRVDAKEIKLKNNNRELRFWARIYADKGQRGWWNGDIFVKQDKEVGFKLSPTTGSIIINENDTVFQVLKLDLPDRVKTFNLKGNVDLIIKNERIRTIDLEKDKEIEFINGFYKLRFRLEQNILYGELISSLQEKRNFSQTENQERTQIETRNIPSRNETRVVIVFIFGTIFLIAMIILSIAFPRPTDFQYKTFRVVLSISAAGVAAMVPGFINIEFTSTPGLLISAGGALGVFVIIYFFNPAKLVTDKKTASKPLSGESKSQSDGLIISRLIHPGLPVPDHNECVIEGRFFNKSNQKVVIDKVKVYDRDGKTLNVTWSNCIDKFGNPEKPYELIGIIDSENIFIRQDNGEEIDCCKVEIFHSLSDTPLIVFFDEYEDWIGQQINSADPNDRAAD